MSSVQEDHAPAGGEMAEATGPGELDGRGGQSPLAESGNIDKIRDILFGVQMRDYEKRFSRLEERLLKESGDLRDETRKRFDALETFIRNELEALTDRLKSEQRTRDEAVQHLSRNLHETGANLDKKLTELDEQTTRAQRDLRQQILEQSKTLSEEIRQKYDELSAIIERKAAELGDEKTDRSALAALFSEVALRLNGEFKIPGDN